MFKLMDKKIIAMLHWHFLLNWPYDTVKNALNADLSMDKQTYIWTDWGDTISYATSIFGVKKSIIFWGMCLRELMVISLDQLSKNI